MPDSPTEPAAGTAAEPAAASVVGPAAWSNADLLAVDLEGSGPQDPDGEAILEIALVPIRAGIPDTASAFSTLINPERPIRRGPWISPGLTNTVLQAAPPLASAAPAIRDQIDGRILVGHNISIDWRLIHAHVPATRPAALLDTLRLAKYRRPDLKKGHSLSAWIERLNLTERITAAAPGSQPHRALWDTVAAAELLRALMLDASPDQSTLNALLRVAGLPMDHPPDRETPGRNRPQRSAGRPPATDQPGLWELR